MLHDVEVVVLTWGPKIESLVLVAALDGALRIAEVERGGLSGVGGPPVVAAGDVDQLGEGGLRLDAGGLELVAAGHPGHEDAEPLGVAAVAASLASCVAETVMTGLLGGGQPQAGGRAGNQHVFVAHVG